MKSVQRQRNDCRLLTERSHINIRHVNFKSSFMARTPALQQALSNAWLKAQGLVSVKDLWRKAQGYAN